MSIDFGIKKIGFAIGQLITKKATPLGIIYNHKENINWADIDNLIKKWKPNIIIIGYPSTDKKINLLKTSIHLLLSLALSTMVCLKWIYSPKFYQLKKVKKFIKK